MTNYLSNVQTYSSAQGVQVKQTQLLVGLLSTQHEPVSEVGAGHKLPVTQTYKQ